MIIHNSRWLSPWVGFPSPLIALSVLYWRAVQNSINQSIKHFFVSTSHLCIVIRLPLSTHSSEATLSVQVHQSRNSTRLRQSIIPSLVWYPITYAIFFTKPTICCFFLFSSTSARKKTDLRTYEKNRHNAVYFCCRTDARSPRSLSGILHTHTHTHIYIYIYIYVYQRV